MYAGLVKREETWYNVVSRLASQWNHWNTSVRGDSYSDCAILDTNTGRSGDSGYFSPVGAVVILWYLWTLGSLLTDNCKVELCPVCLFPQFPVDLQLRGVCLDSEVDKFYILHSDTELHGHTGSVLR